jgi:hypothetical protein
LLVCGWLLLLLVWRVLLPLTWGELMPLPELFVLLLLLGHMCPVR